jgi:hypothetical protein
MKLLQYVPGPVKSPHQILLSNVLPRVLSWCIYGRSAKGRHIARLLKSFANPQRPHSGTSQRAHDVGHMLGHVGSLSRLFALELQHI